jgi:hypothetical protein
VEWARDWVCCRSWERLGIYAVAFVIPKIRQPVLETSYDIGSTSTMAIVVDLKRVRPGRRCAYGYGLRLQSTGFEDETDKPR